MEGVSVLLCKKETSKGGYPEIYDNSEEVPSFWESEIGGTAHTTVGRMLHQSQLYGGRRKEKERKPLYKKNLTWQLSYSLPKATWQALKSVGRSFYGPMRPKMSVLAIRLNTMLHCMSSETQRPHRDAQWWWQHHAVGLLLCSKPQKTSEGRGWN